MAAVPDSSAASASWGDPAWTGWRTAIRARPILVLCGGIDRERPVSLTSGRAVASALAEAGAAVTVGDLSPADTAALDNFRATHGDHGAVFPVFHGPWGEGGGAQALLERCGVAFVGARSGPAGLAMDKAAAKARWGGADTPTPPSCVVDSRDAVVREADAAGGSWLVRGGVVKPLDEGSSLGVEVTDDAAGAIDAVERLLPEHGRVLVEQRIHGKELTVGVVADRALPPIWIETATGRYDYAAKYQRSDTRKRFDVGEPDAVVARVAEVGLAAARALGVSDLCRVDLMLDPGGTPWLIEANTMPGFTPTSLLPRAAAAAGWEMPELVARLTLSARR